MVSMTLAACAGLGWIFYFRYNDEHGFWGRFNPDDEILDHFVFYVVFTLVLSVLASIYAVWSLDRGWLIWSMICQVAMAGGCYVHWNSDWQNFWSLMVMIFCGLTVVVTWRLSEYIQDAHYDQKSHHYLKTTHLNPL
eukprot:UN32437